jgi:hypothetical protein
LIRQKGEDEEEEKEEAEEEEEAVVLEEDINAFMDALNFSNGWNCV